MFSALWVNYASSQTESFIRCNIPSVVLNNVSKSTPSTPCLNPLPSMSVTRGCCRPSGFWRPSARRPSWTWRRWPVTRGKRSEIPSASWSSCRNRWCLQYRTGISANVHYTHESEPDWGLGLVLILILGNQNSDMDRLGGCRTLVLVLCLRNIFFCWNVAGISIWQLVKLRLQTALPPPLFCFRPARTHQLVYSHTFSTLNLVNCLLNRRSGQIR